MKVLEVYYYDQGDNVARSNGGGIVREIILEEKKGALRLMFISDRLIRCSLMEHMRVRHYVGFLGEN